jgi:hypothetical protein
MSTGMKFAKFAGIVVLCLGSLCSLSATTPAQHKPKKPQLPPLPSGPQGPVPPIPLDSIAPVAPQVSFQNGELSIVAPNSTLGDILRAVRKQTGAEIDIPAANERVVTRLGPGPVRQVMADLLNGSHFNYVLLGSAQDSNLLTRVVLVAKTGPENTANAAVPGPPQPGPMQAGNVMPPDAGAEGEAADATEDTGDENAEQPEPAEQAEQPAASPDQPAVKTPQQMLQEMQQRQLQMQQQQNPGQPLPAPPPVRTPQEQ